MVFEDVVFDNNRFYQTNPYDLPQYMVTKLSSSNTTSLNSRRILGRGDDTAGNPRRAQNYPFALFEFILRLELDKRLPVEQFEARRGRSISVSSTLSPS